MAAAGFIFQYGNMVRPAGEVGIDSMSKVAVRSQRGGLQWILVTWRLNGMVMAKNVATLNSELNKIEAGLVDGLDASFKDPDSGTIVYRLRSRDTVGGVTISNLQHSAAGGTGLQGGEYTTYRSYTFELTAKIRPTGWDPFQYIDFQESVVYIGGGPREVYVETTRGRPQRQMVNQMTTFKAVQTGRAIGEGQYPRYPGPIWPFLEMRDRRTVELLGPRVVDRVLTEYGVTWQYSFESAGPMFAFPTFISKV